MLGNERFYGRPRENGFSGPEHHVQHRDRVEMYHGTYPLVATNKDPVPAEVARSAVDVLLPNLEVD